MNTLTFDIEAKGLSVKDRLVCVGWKYNDGPVVVTWAVDGAIKDTSLLAHLADPTVLKVGHNLPYDIGLLVDKGHVIVGPYFDTKLVYKNRNPLKPAGLKQLGKSMGYKMSDFKQVCNDHKPKLKKGMKRAERTALAEKIKQMDWDEYVPKEVTAEYCAKDVDVTYELYKRLGKPTPWDINVELPLIDVVVGMETSGWHIDKERAANLRAKYESEIAGLEAHFPTYEGPKKEIKSIIRSHQKLRNWLVEQGYSKHLARYLTESGELSTDKLAMRALARKTKVGQRILRHRQLDKLVGTYLKKLEQSDTLYGGFNQVGTVTGRFSSSKPNLQNVPSRSKEGQDVRSCFMARPGHHLVVGDLSQIEPRMYAFYSRDEKLLDVFQNDGDFHSTVASAIYGRTDVTKDERFIGKTVGLSVLYGSGAKGVQAFLAKSDVNVSLKEAKRIRDSILSGFPTARRWAQSLRWQADRHPELRTFGGRTIDMSGADYIPAVNYTVQGSCADVMKIILLNLHRAGWKIICTVHDEAVLEVPSADVHKAEKDMRDIMERSCMLAGVPLKADISIVQRWSEAK